ncbi:MAG TPA: EAL domain-containing protein [Burkholderiales bacterium]|nr:EAL domain-containing protein [Burkholderiales bacterium]
MPSPRPAGQGRRGTFRFAGLERRIVLFVGGLLIPVLGSVLLVVNEVNQRNARSAIDDGLAVGGRVFERLLEQNNRQLTQAAEILSLDFAFRQAVATRDLRTTESVLVNHGARIGADLMTLVSLDRRVIADNRDRRLVGQPFRFPWLIDAAEIEGRAAGMEVSEDGQLYQLAVVPVRAPEPIAWAVFGFLVRGRLDKEVSSLTRLGVSFFGKTSGEARWTVLDSTLPPEQLQAQEQMLRGDAAHARHSLTVESPQGEYRTLIMPLPERGAIMIVATLAQSVDEVLAPYRRLEIILLLLGAAALAVSAVGGVLIARGITRPIHALADMSRRIEEGDFTHAAAVEGKDEIAELARRFDRMREGLAAREDQIRRLAYRDVLTDLPNRTLFNDRLRVAMELAERERKPVAVLLLDLDRFKQINDTLGHQTGDQVLQQTARRLGALLRKSDTIARLGGDEFSVLLDCGVEAAKQIAQKLLKGLDEPIVVGEHSLDVRASIGIAGYPVDSADPETLMRHADLAMYAAKRGNLGIAAYDSTLGRHRREQLSLLSELRRAIENDELRLTFQPKIDMSSGEIAGAEVLVRWQHPERGLVPPGDFIPFAEQTGFIKSITRWVIEAAARQSSRWRALGMSLKLLVNISVQDLLDTGMPDVILATLKRHGVPAGSLGLEITESSVMQDQAAAIAVLKRLRALDIDISVDDFGTGYSSLAYVRQLQATELKIDRSFVRNLVQDEKNRAIVLSIIELAHNLDLTVVAEGVEDRSSLEVLRKLGCDLVQGYVFTQPLPEEEFRDWFAAWKPAAARTIAA